MKARSLAAMLALGCALILPATGPAFALDQRSERPGRPIAPPPNFAPESSDVLSPRARMNMAPGENTAPAAEKLRPEPPKAGRRTCVRVDEIAGAQLFGDSAIELTMRDGKRWRMFLADECPGLSFYQGFYYRRGKAGQLCAGRDTIGARSGGECPIASIVPLGKSDD